MLDAAFSETISKPRRSTRRQKSIALTLWATAIAVLLGSLIRVLCDTPTEIDSQDIQLIFALLFVMSLSVILMHSARQLATVETTREIVEAQRKQMEMNQANLLRRLVNAQEDVLARVARELHDEMGQDLAALSLELRELEPMPQSDDHRQRLAAVRTIVERISCSVHSTAWTLRPNSLSDLGLMLALRELIAIWAQRLGVTADTHLEALAEPLDSEASVALYRVVQEALTNMAKHSQASAISVTAQRVDGCLRIAIEDNGRGFNSDSERDDITVGGFGLFGMRERLSLIGGSLNIESSPGNGTTVYASLPLDGRMLESRP
jgi:signal transduction histidine kinase